MIQPGPPQNLSPKLHFRLVVIYIAWALVLLIPSTVKLVQVAQQIGQTYGGFVWTHDPTVEGSFFVAFELWRSLPGSENALQQFDQIIEINGRSTWDFGRVYDAAKPGELVSYKVKRDGQYLIIQEAVKVFTWETFLLSHGLLYLTGLSFLFSGYVLLSSTRHLDQTLLAFALLFGAGAWLSHSEVSGIHAPYIGHGIYEFVLYTPAVPMVGALLLHFACIFPEPNRLIRRFPHLPYLFYAFALVLIFVYTITLSPAGAQLHSVILTSMVVYAVFGMVSVVGRSVVAYFEARRHQDVIQRQVIEALTVVWLVGLFVFCIFGLIPVLLFGHLMLPFEILITLAFLFPLMLVYAVRNAEMINRLHREVALRQQYADQVQELQAIREQTLHEVSDALHDHVIPELRGLHFAATAAQRQASALDQKALSNDLLFISDTLDTLSAEARKIMEGAKPVDWDDAELSQALRWLSAGLLRRTPGMVVKLDVGDYDELDDSVVKDALYWITRAALSNVQDHARASKVTILLYANERATTLRIVDNGVGFDASNPNGDGHSARRHLGLANMRLRAQEINARLTITSRPGSGAYIEVVAPRGDNAT